MNPKKILIGAVVIFIIAATASADWPMFRHDLEHTGYTTEGAPMTNNSLWSFETNNSIGSSPVVIAEGMVFIAAETDKLYALNASPLSMPDNERIIWSYDITHRIHYSPVAANGMIFFGGGAFVAGKYRNETSQQWEPCGDVTDPSECDATIDCKWEQSLSYCAADYTTRQVGSVFALNISNNGSLTWQYLTGAGSPILSSPSIADDVLYIGSSDGKVYALNASTGEFIWNFTVSKFGGAVHSSPVVDSVMFFGTDVITEMQDLGNPELTPVQVPGRVFAVNVSTREMIWNYSVLSTCEPGDDPCHVPSSPAIANGKVFFGSTDKNIYALDQSNGSLIWSFETGDIVKSSPAVAYGMVFIGSRDNNLYALDQSNGSLIWNYSIGLPVDSSPAVANNVVYIGGGNEKVYAFNASTGDLIWTYTTGGPYVDSSPAIVDGAEDGILFIGAGDGKLYALGTLYPDLTINNITTPADIKDGQVIQINAEVVNMGSGTADFDISFYYDQIAPAYLIDSVSTSITHFKSENISVQWDTAGKSGNHTLYAVIDITSSPDDKNNSDNLMSKPINITLADRSLKITPHYKRVKLGNDFTISLNISSDVMITRTEFTLLFNSSVLNLTNVQSCGFFTNCASTTNNNLLNFTSNGTTKNGTGILAELNFNAKNPGSSILNLTNVNFYNTTGTVSGILQVNGKIDVCIAGDVDCDCEVDIKDLMLVAQAFHTKLGDETYDPRADLKQDNIINIFDLAAVGRNYGNTC